MQRNTNIGSISSGTMRKEDLIPTFLYELRNRKPLRREHRTLAREIEERIELEDYYESEESTYDLESLFDALGEYSPEYFYFGSHPGDGSDYGWWLSESFEDDFDGLKVSDLSEVPSDHCGEILVVNDHGNMTLHVRSRNNRMREIWAVV